MPFTIWNTVQACVWFASRDNVAVSSLPENYTFAALAFHAEQELIDGDDDDHAVVIDKGMTFAQLHELRDQIAEYFGPQKADRPGTAWIVTAQKELLAACGHGALKMTGRSLYGGPSRAIPAEAFATLRFFGRDGVDCLGPPDLVDADCWRDLRLLAEDVRRVWPADGSADAASSPSSIKRGFDDDALVAELAAAVRRGEYKSAHAAALARKSDIQGRGTEDSKVRRIADKVRDLLPRSSR